MTGPTPPTVEEGMREAVAQWLSREFAGSVEWGRRVAEELLRHSPIASVLAARERERDEARAERDDAEQRVTNLAAALASAHRARGRQERRADEADDRRVSLERDRIHPAFSVEVQEHRQQAYEGGWSDGYAEGEAKHEAENAALRISAERMVADHAEEIARLHALLGMSPDDDPFTRSLIEQNHQWVANCVEAQRQHVRARAAAPEPSEALTPKEPNDG